MKDEKQGEELSIEVFLKYAISIISTLREPFLVLDKDLRVVSANQAFYTTFKVTEKDTKGELLPDLGNKQWDIPKLLQLLKEIIPERKIVYDYEIEHKFEQIGERVMILNACQLRVSKKIAKIVTAEVAIATESESEGTEELILLAIEDITEREILRKKLVESEERFRRAFETSPDGLLLVHKTEGSVLNSNGSIQKLLGYCQGDLLKIKLWEIGVTKDANDFQDIVARLERDGVFYYEDASVKTKNGSEVSAEIFLTDRTKVIQCNIRDISVRKEAKEKIKILSYAISSAFDSFILTDMKGDINYVNESACTTFGYTLEKFLKLNIAKIDIDPEFAKKILQEIAAKGRWSGEVMSVKNNKEEFYSLLSAFVIKDDEGSPKWIMVILRDITERKKAQDEIQQAYKNLKDTQEQLIQSNKMSALGQLASGIAHELNNPLTGVLNNVQLIKMEAEASKDFKLDDFKELLDVVEESAKRCKKIAQSLLDFTHIATTAFMQISIKDIISKTIDLVNQELKLRNIIFKEELQSDLPNIQGSSQLLQQVFYGIFVNSKWAIEKKTKEGGAITVKASQNAQTRMIDISIFDTGIGIPQEDIPKLFTPFFTTKDIGEGTGLGLAIFYNIIKSHKGDIRLESQVGVGTTVLISLPY